MISKTQVQFCRSLDQSHVTFLEDQSLHDDVIEWKHFPRHWPLWGEFTGEFPSQRPVTRSFDASFDLRLNKRLSKQSFGWWFETPSRPLWRHCNGHVTQISYQLGELFLSEIRFGMIPLINNICCDIPLAEHVSTDSKVTIALERWNRRIEYKTHRY